jgi:integrase/recombinase XerD
MLNLSRRHSTTKCGKTKKRDCTCPIWVTGSLHGKKMRKALGIRNWEAAQKIVRDWEARIDGGHVTVKEAFERFIAARTVNKKSEATMVKYRLLEREMVREFGSRSLDTLRVDELDEYRLTWKLAGISARKKIERMRTFFKFCMSRGWTEKNPAKDLDLPDASFSPTLPVSDVDFEKLIAATERYPKKGIYAEKTGERVKGFLLLLRYSGLRIGDVVRLKRENIQGNKLLIRTAKTKVNVWLPLPQFVIEALPAGDGAHYFWSGVGNPKSCITDWQRSLSRLAKVAGIKFHAHMLRNSFAIGLLEKGVSLENVAVLLGNSVKIAERHYATWVKVRQDALEEAVRRTFSEPNN